MLLAGSDIDWTQVLVALIAGLPATLSAIFAYRVALQLRTPSGEQVGALVEKTHDLSVSNTTLTMQVHKHVTNGSEE